MTIDIITLFPDIFKPFLKTSIIGRAIKDKKLKVKLIDLRDFGIGAHKQVDDRPYGGGVGMVMRVDVISRAISNIKYQKSKIQGKNQKVILLTPQGRVFNQRIAQKLSKLPHLVLVCGHYEGVDERVRKLVDEEISIGDYVLSGGEPAAMVVLDAVTRLIPGVLDKEATTRESFSNWKLKIGNSKILLEHPQYTRPEEFKGIKVPKVLLSGNHRMIKEWRLEQALKKTKKRRPDLIK